MWWLFVVAFNVVGTLDLLADYYDAIQAGLPAQAGEMGAAYVIPVLYVPMLMITHVYAFYRLAQPLIGRRPQLMATPLSLRCSSWRMGSSTVETT